MKITKAQWVYFLSCNLPVSFIICITCSLLADIHIDWINFLYNLLLSYTISNLVSIFVPLVQIGKRFTKKFNVPNDTYKGNIRYRLLAGLIITLIFFVFVNPTLTVFNHFYYHVTPPMLTFLTWFRNAPIVILVGYVISLISDFFSYRLARLIDPNF